VSVGDFVRLLFVSVPTLFALDKTAGWSWIIENPTCAIVQLLKQLTLTATGFCLTAMAVDQYYAIKKLFPIRANNERIATRGTFCIILGKKKLTMNISTKQ
jgi:hypothetical protein